MGTSSNVTENTSEIDFTDPNWKKHLPKGAMVDSSGLILLSDGGFILYEPPESFEVAIED